MSANPPSANPLARIYAWWMAVPPQIREPFKSAVVSAALGLVTAVSALSSAYFASDGNQWNWKGFIPYLFSPHSVGAIAVAIAAIYRARQAKVRVDNTVTLRSGAEATIIKPAPQPPTP
jgi:hypothetical protein